MSEVLIEENISLQAANNIRALSAAMVEKAKSGHPGGAMGGADFIQVLYAEFLKFDPQDPSWMLRDRFFLDPGHMSAMLYAQLHLIGKYTKEEIQNFRQWGSPTAGHPEVDIERGIENTSGPLGQGHTMAIGSAIAERFLADKLGEWFAHKTYTFISDGGIQSEISQGAGRIAGHLGLNNLIMFYDANNVQLSTKVDEVSGEDVAQKYLAWGWNVIEIDGNDQQQIREALYKANDEKDRPTLIIGNTVMGKGAVDSEGNSFEGMVSTHGQPLSGAGASFAQTIEALGGNAEDPFEQFEGVEEFYADVLSQRSIEAQKRKEAVEKLFADSPVLAEKVNRFYSGKIDASTFKEVTQKDNIATRAASANVLSVLADKVDNMIVASADLSNSDKTDAFLKKTTAFQKNDFSGAFLQAGVCELTMAALANGIGLHGGVHVAVATFFVFSDYMKPAVRLSALMEVPVKYIWTHDAFRVGEDGPTHQPIEQEAQIRLLEKLENHSGENSLLALRPADSNETTVAWQMAMENTQTPTALILSRQNIKTLEGVDASQAKNGAYVVKAEANPDVVLIANGSEVATLVEGEKLLAEKGIKAQIVSVISEGLFKKQSEAYIRTALPLGVPRFGLTAGLPVTLEGLVGDNGSVFGLKHFGYSAPAGTLDQKFGFTADNVLVQVEKLLSK